LLAAAKGSRLEAADQFGMTALMWAARDGSDGAARALLAAGASKSARSLDGKTASEHAAARGRAVLAALLAP
jgi:ankyrin repeat protein